MDAHGMLVDTDLPQNGRSGVKKIYFGPKDLFYFAVQIEQLRARASTVSRLLRGALLPVSTHTRVVAIQRHDFRVPALNLRSLFHDSCLRQR
jgi:hypothetical protein